MHICEWNDCKIQFGDAQELQAHLVVHHIGRKVTRNLCLNCHWRNCTSIFHKRDHIISHIKIHLDHKPYMCRDCPKKFKRPQDLKKHEIRRHKERVYTSDTRPSSEEKSSEIHSMDLLSLIKTDESHLINKEQSEFYSYKSPTISFIIN